MWSELVKNLEAIKARSNYEQIDGLIEYAKSTKADSKKLGFLLICLYAQINNDDLELHSYFLNCFHLIGENALGMRTFEKVLDSTINMV